MAALLDGEDMDEWLWPESCAELRQIESSLRCLICGDFLHGPVMLPCTHTFCSECVRRFLQSRGAHGCCPECKQSCVPTDLVPNRSLEKIGVLFQQMKPKLLPMLNAKTTKVTKGPDASPTKRRLGGGNSSSHSGGGGDGKPPERVPLLSYNFMKDKEIKKLLELIGIRAPIKNREDIIQIHKEYGLLANAQADSSHPKSAKQIRDEVMRNYRARQQEKQVNSGRKSLDGTVGGQSAVITAEMQAGFERLRQQVKAQSAKAKAVLQESGRDSEDTTESGSEINAVGVWRHVHALKSDQEFYIHSVTQEIRIEPPREFVEQQKRRQEQADQVASEDSEPVIALPGTPAASYEVTEIASDDDEDFVMMTSPPPRPPLSGSRQSTPQSRKKTTQRRTSLNATPSSAPFFSQDPTSPSCSIQETASPYVPSMSMPLTADANDGDDDDLEATQPSPSTSKWECPRCTLVNDTPGLVECEACGYQHRPARKKQKMQFQRKIFSSLS